MGALGLLDEGEHAALDDGLVEHLGERGALRVLLAEHQVDEALQSGLLVGGGRVGGQGAHLLVDDLEGQRREGRRLVRVLERRDLVEDAAERPHIRGLVTKLK